IRIADKYRKRRKYRIGRYFFTSEPYFKRRYLSIRLKNVIDEYKIDLVESYDWSGPLWKKPSVPLIVLMHGAHTSYNFYEGKRTSRLLRFFERRNLEMADYLTAVSKHIGDLTLRSFGIERLYEVIYNGVDTDRFYPRNDSSIVNTRLLYVGRVVPRKGLAELFKAINYLFVVDERMELFVVGPYTQEYIDELLAFVAKEFLQRIHFL